MADDKKKKIKARTPSAVKRELQNEKRRILNKAFRSKVNTAVKAFNEATVDFVKDKLGAVYSMMDKGVKKGVFTQNKADRFKSRITKRAAAKA